MASAESLGILGVEAIHYYVRDLERSRHFYVNQLDFAEVGQSGARLNEGGQQRSVVFEAAACRVVCSTPIGEGGRASRYLAKHPDGVGSIIFRVQDIERTFRLLETRGGTPVHDIETDLIDSEQFRTFVVTTPFGDTTFRFVERTHGYRLYPGMTLLASSQSSHNAMGLTHFDHITSNFETMSPALLWLEHVLGFERFWDVQFHTDDVRQREGAVGSGLRSAVMWDPASGVKFANNEPYRPHFRESQINVFHEQHRGDGIQHLAIAVSDIVSAVRRLRARGVEFMSTPSTYYDSLSERLLALGIGSIDEDPAELAELQILLDGDRENSYLLQIFLKDSAEFHKSADAGPFFYELIQRKGDQGFGAGNFRALFESIERDQRKAGG
jgi:4-hydroxyphenylpyruvate dioxygenase